MRTENSVILASIRPVSQEVLETHNQLLLTIIARRPSAFNGRAVISIDLPKGNPMFSKYDTCYLNIIKNVI